MKREFWITAGLSGLIALSAFFLFVIWRPILTSQKTEKGDNATVKIDQKIAGKEEVKPLESGMTINSLIQDAEMPKESGFKPFFGEETEKIKDTFLERFSSLTKLPEIPSLVPFTTPSAPEEEPKIQLTPKKVLTDEEWFKIAYPEPVIKILEKTEKAMRLRGFLAESEKFEFTSEEKIHLFWHKMIDWGLEEKVIDEKQAEDFRNGIDVVMPNIHKQERRAYEQKLNVYLFKLIGSKLFKTAYAQNECYREGAGMGGGYNTWAMCCNCGWGYYGDEIVYYEDCGESYAAYITCDIIYAEIACEGMCAYPLPMIWDQTSGFCGCDP